LLLLLLSLLFDCLVLPVIESLRFRWKQQQSRAALAVACHTVGRSTQQEETEFSYVVSGPDWLR